MLLGCAGSRDTYEYENKIDTYDRYRILRFTQFRYRILRYLLLLTQLIPTSYKHYISAAYPLSVVMVNSSQFAIDNDDWIANMTALLKVSPQKKL